MSGSGVGSSRSVRCSRKNYPGSRQDIGWQHGTAVEAGNTKKIRCNYCLNEFVCGITRFKHHLACSRKDIAACPSVPDKVKNEMIDAVKEIIEIGSKKRKFGLGTENCEVEEEDSVSVAHSSKKVDSETQTTINQMFKRDAREDACRQIARFFYTSAIPFNCVKNPEFVKMCEVVSKFGKGFIPPSYHEIREKYLELEVERTKEYVETHKSMWKDRGCTVMSDGWTDKKRRSICNFLVNSTMGTVFLSSVDTSHISKSADKVCEMLERVVDEVGEENVVQVVTDNAANYKLAGKMLMEKKPTIFWTPCAAHCIDLMLEDFEKKFEVHKITISKGKKITNFIYARSMLISIWKKFSKDRDLVRPGATRFATSYLTLDCLRDQKVPLMTLFSSPEWKASRFARLRDGKFIESVVMDSSFWDNIMICLKAAFPLIRVLRLVDSDKKPAMPFIYDEMKKCKEKIKKNFKDNEIRYGPILEIIDGRWDNQLSRPLHYAAYSLNPQLRYRDDFRSDIEIKTGLYECLLRMVPDENVLKKIDDQLNDFQQKRGLFGITQAKITWATKDPADWWFAFGDSAPELQRVAMRILSLTCSSSGCERNWSAFDMVHTKKRNRLHQKKMNDLVYVMCNTKLETKESKKEIDVEDLSSDDEWLLDTNEDDGDFDIDGGEDNIVDLDEDGFGHGNDDEFDEGNDFFEEDMTNEDEF